MRRTLLLLATVTLAVLLASGVAGAITYGQPDDDRHPYVGALVGSVQVDGQEVKFVLCSGTLISSTEFLTAAHCVVDNEQYGISIEGVTFDPTFDQDSPLITGTVHAHPLFEREAAYFHDIAVITLNRPVRDVGYGKLPRAQLLDRLNREGALEQKKFTSVGYGRQERTHDPGSGSPTFGSSGVRMFSTQLFRTLTKNHLKLSQNPALGYGGTCYGDSGGPIFLGGPSSNQLVALTSTGDAVCTATSVNYRLDTQEAQDFLKYYDELP
jgi:secreted trypsin-like serine protease